MSPLAGGAANAQLEAPTVGLSLPPPPVSAPRPTLRSAPTAPAAATPEPRPTALEPLPSLDVVREVALPPVVAPPPLPTKPLDDAVFGSPAPSPPVTLPYQPPADAVATARPAPLVDDPGQGWPSAAQAATRPLSPLPAITDDGDDDDDFGSVTVITNITDEIRALQKGYRQTSLREALSKRLGSYDDAAEIQVHSETWMDGLLVEELLTDAPPSPEPKILVTAYGRTDQGRKRPTNEDSLLLMPDRHVYIVADGMGGHAAGEIASNCAVETIRKAFDEGRISGAPNVFWPVQGDELARTVEMANAEIYRQATEDERFTGMGTTLSGIRLSPNRQRAYIAHVGDSRCYRFRNGELSRLTTDHNVGQLYGVKGPMAAHLCRAVGIEPTVEVDLIVDLPEPGDLYLLCSDGLTKMIKERRLPQYLIPGTDLPTLVDSLVDAANGRGGLDNITVLMVQIDAV